MTTSNFLSRKQTLLPATYSKCYYSMSYYLYNIGEFSWVGILQLLSSIVSVPSAVFPLHASVSI